MKIISLFSMGPCIHIRFENLANFDGGLVETLAFQTVVKFVWYQSLTTSKCLCLYTRTEKVCVLFIIKKAALLTHIEVFFRTFAIKV